MKTTAKDFFLQLGTMVCLYVGAGALLNLLFRVINEAYPRVADYYRSFGSPISLPVATLIVVFPLFLLLSNVLRKSYEVDPSRRDYSVRKWLIYITLFIAGGIVAGDLITLIYYFLDGQELTIGFLLKVLSVLVVTGAIFGYYLSDLRNRLTNKSRMIWIIFAAIIVLGSIVAGFTVLGSPSHQRSLRYDSERVSGLQQVQWQIVNYWQTKRVLPSTLDDLSDPLSGTLISVDPETGEDYEYRVTGPLSFELCATFVEEGVDPTYAPGVARALKPGGGSDVDNGSWGHPAGPYCFPRTIDPERYPPTPKPLG